MPAHEPPMKDRMGWTPKATSMLAGAFALLLADGAAASARRPEPLDLRCAFESGRWLRSAQLEPDARDDDLHCEVTLGATSARSRRLVSELALQPPTGASRTVASANLERDEEKPRWQVELRVPHSTWTSAVRRDREGRPYLQLSLRVSEAGSGKRWRVLATTELRLGGPPRRRPTRAR
jgi:hypothetical protein